MECGGGVYRTFLRNVWGSFSARSLVIWSPQVAGGDEPPSVLSDNLPKVWLMKPDLSSCEGRTAAYRCHVCGNWVNPCFRPRPGVRPIAQVLGDDEAVQD
jgi:hypothetical protein